MALLDAATVLAELQGHGHNYNPVKQLYKVSLGDATCIVYDARGTACTVQARDIEQYVAKGMTLTAPVPAGPAEDGGRGDGEPAPEDPPAVPAVSSVKGD